MSLHISEPADAGSSSSQQQTFCLMWAWQVLMHAAHLPFTSNSGCDNHTGTHPALPGFKSNVLPDATFLINPS